MEENTVKEVSETILIFYIKGGFPVIAGTTRSELASTRKLAE